MEMGNHEIGMYGYSDEILRKKYFEPADLITEFRHKISKVSPLMGTYTTKNLISLCDKHSFVAKKFSKRKNSYILVEPDWGKLGYTVQQSTAIVEETILGMEISPFYILKANEKQCYLMNHINTLKSLYCFMKDGFALKNPHIFALANGKFFSELPLIMQKHFEENTFHSLFFNTEFDDEIMDLISDLANL